MQAHTKKLRTDDIISLTVAGPATNKARVLRAVKLFGFTDMSDSIAWRDAFPEYSEDELCGKVLAGMRCREDMTQKELSECTGIPQRHISEMENGKRPIGKKNAQKLAKALNADYKVFL
jgi:SOS-response transcriptional repressor LexA